MGLFSRLAQNFKHGGVKMQLQAPGSVSTGDASVPITVTISATDSPQKVNSVKVEVIAQSQPVANVTTPPQRRVIAAAQNTQAFQLAAGSTQTVSLNLAMNVGAAAAEQFADNPAVAAIANAVGQVGQVAAALDQTQYTYTIQAVADVDNITLDPQVSQPIQVVKPGSMGTGLNISV